MSDEHVANEVSRLSGEVSRLSGEVAGVTSTCNNIQVNLSEFAKRIEDKVDRGPIDIRRLSVPFLLGLTAFIGFTVNIIWPVVYFFFFGGKH